MLKLDRAYFDHAATSWPKPPGVLQSFLDFESDCGAAAGRSPTRAGSAAQKIVDRTRHRLAQILGAPRFDQIAFTQNGTMALNAALLGLLRHGDHVIASAADHNSLLRPLEMLKDRGTIEWTCVPVDTQGKLDLKQLQDAIRPNTVMVASTHASNVTGCIQPIEAIAEIARQHRLLFLLDAAQSLGHLPIDVESMSIDILAAPGHKGLGGMLGTGLLYLGDSAIQRFQSPWIGGTGVASESLSGPFEWSHALESGNLNTPAIASLLAGIEWAGWKRSQPSPEFLEHHEALRRRWNRLREILQASACFELVGRTWDQWEREVQDGRLNWLPIVSVISPIMSPQEWCSVLDSDFGIETRAGFHCAAQIHHYLHTGQTGGTLRFSLGLTSTDRDVDQLEAALAKID